MIIPDEIRIVRRERVQDNIRNKLFAQRTVKLLQLLNIARYTEHVSVKRAALSHLMTEEIFSHLKFLNQETLYIKLIFFVLVVPGDFFAVQPIVDCARTGALRTYSSFSRLSTIMNVQNILVRVSLAICYNV
jgi:hypothetical protein